MIKLPYSAIKAFLHLFGSPVCSGETLPPTDFNFCTPDIRASEIRRIFIARVSAEPFVDWTNATEWAYRLTQTGGDVDAIRTLWVIGDKPAPIAKRVVISGGRKVTVRKDHVIKATIDDVNETNHEFVMGLGAGKHFRVWYETMGGFMFGGNAGIVTLFNADMVLLRGQGEIMTYQATLDWNNLRTEDKCISPIFDDVEPVCDVDAPEITIEQLIATIAKFSWAIIPGVTVYQYQFLTTPDAPLEGAWIDTTTMPLTFTGLTPDTNYYFHLRAVCANGIASDYSSEAVTTLADVLPVMSGLLAYYPSYRGITTDGTNVTVWTDATGNGNDLEAIGTGPTIVPHYFPNGERAIKFDAPQGMQTAGNFIGLNGSSAYTILIVAKADTPAGANQFFVQYSNTPDISTITDGWEVTLLGSNLTFGHWGDVGLNKEGASGFTNFQGKIMRIDKHQNAANEIIGYSWDAGASGGIGAGVGSDNTNEFGDYKLTVGSAADGTDGLKAKVGAIAIWNRRLNVTEVVIMKNFMVAQFGFGI